MGCHWNIVVQAHMLSWNNKCLLILRYQIILDHRSLILLMCALNGILKLTCLMPHLLVCIFVDICSKIDGGNSHFSCLISVKVVGSDHALPWFLILLHYLCLIKCCLRKPIATL